VVRIDGNFESNRNYYLKNEKELKEKAVKEVAAEEKGQAGFVEKGEELLNLTRVANDALMFVKSQKLDPTTAGELRELYEMAGIGSRPLPSAVEYARIANFTKADLAKFKDFETEKNISTLFSNSDLMDDLFDESLI
jgi:hypothetical protein